MSESNSYLNAFLIEARDLLENIESSCLSLEENPLELEAVHSLFRSVHTLKGSGGMFGLDDVSHFAHHLETLLDVVRTGQIQVSEGIIGIVLESRDLILAMIDSRNGAAAPSAEIQDQIVHKILSFLPNHESTESTETQAVQIQTPTVNQKEELFRISFKPEPELFRSGTDPFSLIEELQGLGKLEITAALCKTPNWDQFNPEECFFSWELVLKTASTQDDIQDVFIFVEHVSQIKIEKIDTLIIENEIPKLGEILVHRGSVSEVELHQVLENRPKIGEVIAESGITHAEEIATALQEQSAIKKLQNETVAQEETIRVASSRLNQMINLVGELVILKSQLSQIATDVGRSDLINSAESFERLISELRDHVLNVRMIPVGASFGRFKRLVRDLSKDLGKKIRLETFGEETELDKSVVDKLAEPLVHMIRNSADHGLESPEDRISQNKDETGTIRLIAENKGSYINLIVGDDGRGLNLSAIKNRALERGLITAEQNLSEQEIYQLIFAPGFSTAEKVTSVSGRGVGMDVVKREIESLRGKIHIRSRPGLGADFILTLPLTMSIIDGLLVEVNQEPFVIPVASVEECEELFRMQGAHDHGRQIIYLRNMVIPYIRLRDLFNYPLDPQIQEEIVIIQHDKNLVGLVVDKIIGDHQTVVKSLGKVAEKNTLVSGATILGNGNVALILDVKGIVDEADLEEHVWIQEHSPSIS